MTRRVVTVIIAYFLVIDGTSAHEIHIGLVWVGKSGMAERISNSMQDQLKLKAPQIHVQTIKQLSSEAKLAQVVAKWSKRKDGIVILRSNGAKWLAQNPPVVSTFTGGHTHPLSLGVSNLPSVTGVTYYVPKALQFHILQRVVPNMSRVMLLSEKGHPSSVIDQTDTKEVADKLGLEYSDVLVSSKKELIEVVTQAKQDVDLFIIGNQALVFDNAKEVIKAAGDTAVISYSKAPIIDGALGGFVPDDDKLGKMLADSVIDVLVEGKDIKTIPYKVDDNPILIINAKALERYQLTIPENVKSRVKFIN